MAVFTTPMKSTTEAILHLAGANPNVTSVTSGAVTLTAAEVVNGTYVQSGTPGAVAKQFPTAAAIVAGIVDPEVGMVFDFYVQNGGDGVLTFTTNTGLTLVGTMTVAAGANKRFTARVTNVGTPAVTITA